MPCVCQMRKLCQCSLHQKDVGLCVHLAHVYHVCTTCMYGTGMLHTCCACIACSHSSFTHTGSEVRVIACNSLQAALVTALHAACRALYCTILRLKVISTESAKFALCLVGKHVRVVVPQWSYNLHEQKCPLYRR